MTETTNWDEIKRVTVMGWLHRAKKQAIESGDTEWLERLHEIERKYTND